MQTQIHIEKATIRQGCGYWDTTVYPVGGCFRRAGAPIEIERPEVMQTFDNGAPKLLKGSAGGRKVAVQADVCDFVTKGGAL